jgi:hypothetical protein
LGDVKTEGNYDWVQDSCFILIESNFKEDKKYHKKGKEKQSCESAVHIISFRKN